MMKATQKSVEQKPTFTSYEIFMIALLSILQFTVVLDFMILSPLSYKLLKQLSITPEQFGFVVAAYALSAGISGFLAASFADKFDRKKMLMVFYVGFVIGTAFCALANSYETLLAARIVTGIFGGVIGSIGVAIITDLFKIEVRGRVMGFTQMAFASSQALGIPAGLWLTDTWNWHAPFWTIVVLSIIIGVIMAIYMKPVNEHLKIKSDRNPVDHLLKTISNPEYTKGFLATLFLATGGFMLMPLGTAFSTNNLKVLDEDVKLVFIVTGAASVIFGPFIGKLSDSIGKYKVFVIGSIISFVLVGIYTNLGPTPLWLVMLLNVILFVGITSRMISSQALTSAVPLPQDRGAFMSINSSAMQLAGGIAAIIAGKIVTQSADGVLHGYNVIGYSVMGSILIALGLYYLLNEQVQKKLNKKI